MAEQGLWRDAQPVQTCGQTVQGNQQNYPKPNHPKSDQEIVVALPVYLDKTKLH